MEPKKHTLAYIKRQAKELKKVQGISHTAALELTAKEYGYSNWQHCCRSFDKIPPPIVVEPDKPMEHFEISFTQWLTKHKNRNSPLGDLASDMLADKDWPEYDPLEQYEVYLSWTKQAHYLAIEALKRAWKSYRAYVKRSQNPSLKKVFIKKEGEVEGDHRKITFVRAVQLPFDKRTIEKFDVGDPAWISWDGRKAIPVIVKKVDDRNYSVEILRPLKNKGNSHSLFLDEVRSTPLLACINCVTL